MEDGIEQVGGGGSAEGELSGGHFVQDCSEGKKVSAGIEFAAAGLLGRHVGGGADRGARTGEVRFDGLGSCGLVLTGATRGRDLGQAEIENLGVAALGYEDVGGFDVAVHDAFGVRGIECVGDLDGEGKQSVQLERSCADQVFERLAVEKLHGDEGLAVLFADVVNGANVGVVQCGCGLGLALKAGERLRVAGYFIGKEFQGYEAMQARVFGFINHAHAAAAEFLDDAIVGNGLADHCSVDHVRSVTFGRSFLVDHSWSIAGVAWFSGRLILRTRLDAVNEVREYTEHAGKFLHLPDRSQGARGGVRGVGAGSGSGGEWVNECNRLVSTVSSEAVYLFRF